MFLAPRLPQNRYYCSKSSSPYAWSPSRYIPVDPGRYSDEITVPQKAIWSHISWML